MEKQKTAGVRGVSPVGEKILKTSKRLWIKKIMEKMSFEPGVKNRGSDGW